MNLRPLALALALAVTTLGAAVPQTADACGGYETPEAGVYRAVARHFQALDAHDRAAVLAVWRPGATVVTEGTPVRVEPIERAATRWVAAKGPVTFHVADVQASEDSAVAHVAVELDGQHIEETLVFAPTDAGQWVIAGETSRTVGTHARVRAALPK